MDISFETWKRYFEKLISNLLIIEMYYKNNNKNSETRIQLTLKTWFTIKTTIKSKNSISNSIQINLKN